MPRNHRREVLDGDALDARRKKVATLAELAQMDAMEEASGGAKEYVRRMKDISKNARDDRARFSATKALLDIVLPKKEGPLVSINVGQNFVSHLGLPPPPEPVKVIEVGPVMSRGLLPEPEVMVKLIGPGPEERMTKITPEDGNGRPFRREPIDITTTHEPPEITRIEPEKVYQATPATLKAVPAQPKGHPAAHRYDP